MSIPTRYLFICSQVGCAAEMRMVVSRDQSCYASEMPKACLIACFCDTARVIIQLLQDHGMSGLSAGVFWDVSGHA
jgi:hypothetical protein